MSEAREQLLVMAMSERTHDLTTSDPAVQPCSKAPILWFSSYRIWNGGPRRPHWAHRFHTDRWCRTWQGEWEVLYGTVADECMFSPRSWTRRGAERKARRWYRRGTDVGRSRRARPWVRRTEGGKP